MESTPYGPQDFAQSLRALQDAAGTDDILRGHYGGSRIVYATSVPAKFEDVENAETFIYINKPKLLKDHANDAYSLVINVKIVTRGKLRDKTFPVDTFEFGFTGRGVGEPTIDAGGKRLDLLPTHIRDGIASPHLLTSWKFDTKSILHEIGLFRAHHPEVDFEALAKQVEAIIQELLQREEIQVAARKGIFGFEALKEGAVGKSITESARRKHHLEPYKGCYDPRSEGVA